MTATHSIPPYAMLDVWMALGGDPAAFDRIWTESNRTPADTWAQLMAAIKAKIAGIEHWSWDDMNPPAGPEFEALL